MEPLSLHPVPDAPDALTSPFIRARIAEVRAEHPNAVLHSERPGLFEVRTSEDVGYRRLAYGDTAWSAWFTAAEVVRRAQRDARRGTGVAVVEEWGWVVLALLGAAGLFCLGVL